MKHRLFCTIFPSVCLLLAASNAAAQIVTDNFDDGDDALWTRVDPLSDATGNALSSIYSFPGGNSYRIQGVASPNPTVLGPARAGSARLDVAQTTFNNRVDVIDWDESLAQTFAIVARSSDIGLGTTDAYVLGYSVRFEQFFIDRVDNETPTDGDFISCFCDSFTNIALDSAKDYRLVFRGNGNTLIGEVFDLDDLSTPLAAVSAVDATYASGSPGLLTSASLPDGAFTGTDVTFDNFVVSNVPEPTTFWLLAAGSVWLAGSRQRR